MAKRFLDFLAGAAVGAAVVAYLKSDKEKLAAILDKAEAALSGGAEAQDVEDAGVAEHTQTKEEE